MSRKSEDQLLREAIVELTKAVNLNTRTLAEAMGKSLKSVEDLGKQLQDLEQHRIPADAGPEEILNRMTQRLAPGLPISAFPETGPTQLGEGEKVETTLPLHHLATRPIFGGLLQNAADNARAERELKQGEDYASQRYGSGEPSSSTVIDDADSEGNQP